MSAREMLRLRYTALSMTIPFFSVSTQEASINLAGRSFLVYCPYNLGAQ